MIVELSSIVGMVLGLSAITIGMVLKGASLSALLNPAAIMIIFVGTAASLFNGFPMAQMKEFPLLIKKLFQEQKLMPKMQLLELFVHLSQTARREGLLALEGQIGDIEDPFLKNGMNMMIDGMDPDFIRDVLEAEVETMEERHRNGALMFSQAGMYAPTLGVLGAVIGLVAALGNLDDIEKLGHSIAAAFIATLFGIFTGYVIWHPFANKMKLLSKKEVAIKRIIIEGILSLQAGDSPVAVEAKLKAFLSQTERQQLEAKVETRTEGEG